MSPFKYCLNSSTIKPTPILEKIRIAGETGYAGIELWHDDIDAHLESGGSMKSIQDALSDHGLEVPTTIFLKGWWDTEGEEYRQKMDEIRRRLEQAAAVGAPHSIAGPPHGVVDLDHGAEQYARLLEVGREFGVRPVFEYLGFSQMVHTVDIARDVLERCGDPDGTTVVDPFHCFRGDGGCEGVADLKASQIAVSHFNDAPAVPPREEQRDPHRVMPGDGIVQLDVFLKALKSTGYTGHLSLELFNEMYWADDPQSVAELGLRKMKDAVESVFPGS